MHVLDYLAISLYFAVLLWVGYRAMRGQKKGSGSESFMAADRDTNLLQTTATTAATDIGGGFSIAMGGLGFTLGISGSWLIAVSGLSIVFASFLMVPRVKRWADRVKGLTTGDLFEARFDRRTGSVAAIVIALAWFTFVGGQIIAGGKLLQATLDMNLELGIFLAGAVILAYTAMGGLKAVIHTDVFQMLVLFVGIILVLVPIGLFRVGGWDGLVTQLSANPETAGLVRWDAVSWKQALGWFFAIFPIWFISIAALQRIIAARDERTARRAFLFTGVPIEWPLFAVGSTLVGLFARVLVPDLTDAELATPTMILTLLPVGLAGVVIAAYIAAVMSSADSCLIGPVSILTNDVYRKLYRPQACNAELLRVARALTLVLGVLAIGLAYLAPSVLDLVLYAYTFGAAGVFFPMLGLLFWRRTTASGAFWSMVLGGGSAIAWTVAGEPWGFAASWAGWVIALPTLVIVSLASTHGPQENPDLFR